MMRTAVKSPKKVYRTLLLKKRDEILASTRSEPEALSASVPSPDVVEVAVRRMDCGSFAQGGAYWEVVWPLLGDLSFKFGYGPAGSEMAFDSHGARKYGPDFLLSFAWLYINGLLRECRQVDASRRGSPAPVSGSG